MATISPSRDKRSIRSYMAEIEQYLNDIYRFYDDPDMRGALSQRIDLILAYHDSFIERTPAVFETLDTKRHEEWKYLYRHHALKSKRLFSELKSAIRANDLELIKDILDQLDENRREAHTIFG